MKYLLEFIDEQDQDHTIGEFDSMKEIEDFLENIFRIRGVYSIYFREYECGIMLFGFKDFTEKWCITEIEDDEIST